jgi:hypothetical protein
MWSAAVDPRVLTASAVLTRDRGRQGDRALAPMVRSLRSPGVQHLLIDRGDLVRVDLIGDSLHGEPRILHFYLPDDDWLDDRLAAIRILRGQRGGGSHPQLARRLPCLWAIDVRDAGASLKEIADYVLGTGDWPGDGEHRKSMVRRMIATGDRMLRDGPCAILQSGPNRQDRPKLSHRRNREDAG